MNLGEQIYKLRTEKNLSQGDVADLLDVSRQSISKWENNTSVPELDKLVKLSEIFSVSLDELILDKKQSGGETKTEPQIVYVERIGPRSSQKTVGAILLCFAGLVLLMISLFGEFLSGLILAAPFAAWGIICLLVRKYAGLWCAWVAYLFVDIYMRFASGVHWMYIFYPHVYNGEWTIHLIVAWGLTLAFGTLIVITAFCTCKAVSCSTGKDGKGTAACWAVYFLSWIVFSLPALRPDMSTAPSYGYRFVSAFAGWMRTIALVTALVFTIRLFTALWNKHKKM